MSRKAIINAELVMRDHLIPEAMLQIEDGRIADFGEMRSHEPPQGCEIIDAQGLYVGPRSHRYPHPRRRRPPSLRRIPSSPRSIICATA